MPKRAAVLVFAVFATLLPSTVTAARSDYAARTCLPISVATTAGVFTYVVRVEGGALSCPLARAVVRDAADWPPGADDGEAALGWSCVVGQSRAAWAVSCRRGPKLVRAYGPETEHDPIVIAAARLRIGVLAPTTTVGLAPQRERVRRCGQTKSMQVDYARGDGATLTLAEGRPTVCANLGVSPQLAVWRIHGASARLIEFCAPAGCARLTGDYALDWRERGLEITLVTHGLGQRELLAIARSLRSVPV